MAITEYDLTEQYHGVVAEVYYQYHPLTPSARPVVTYNTGLLTTERAECSRGQPVWVAGSNMRHSDPLEPGRAYGPADLPAGYVMVVLPNHPLTDPACLPVAARAAGYNCEAGDSLE